MIDHIGSPASDSPRRPRRRIDACRLGAASLAALLVIPACGDETASPSSSSVSTIAPATTVGPDDSTGGFGAPAATTGEFELTATWAIVGRADLDRRGCWWVRGDRGRGLLIAPPGTELGEAGDTLVLGDGTVIADGTELDIDGGLIFDVELLPGGADGKWGNYATFCGTDDPVVVAETLVIPGEIDVDAAAAELAEVGAALFDTDHACGYGFLKGSADERWRVSLSAVMNRPAEAGTVTLPDERFRARVSVGRHLFVNNCDDVVEWFEPDRTVAATWPIVAGTFEYPGGDGAGDCSQGAETTTLVGAVVDVDGTLVELEPITIENIAFGCFAG